MQQQKSSCWIGRIFYQRIPFPVYTETDNPKIDT